MGRALGRALLGRSSCGRTDSATDASTIASADTSPFAAAIAAPIAAADARAPVIKEQEDQGRRRRRCDHCGGCGRGVRGRIDGCRVVAVLRAPRLLRDSDEPRIGVGNDDVVVATAGIHPQVAREPLIGTNNVDGPPPLGDVTTGGRGQSPAVPGTA